MPCPTNASHRHYESVARERRDDTYDHAARFPNLASFRAALVGQITAGLPAKIIVRALRRPRGLTLARSRPRLLDTAPRKGRH